MITDNMRHDESGNLDPVATAMRDPDSWDAGSLRMAYKKLMHDHQQLLASISAPAVQGEPVGEAVALRGASGFTTAVFESSKVPEGTKLYASPKPAEQQPEPAYQQPAPDVAAHLVEALFQQYEANPHLTVGRWIEHGPFAELFAATRIARITSAAGAQP